MEKETLEKSKMYQKGVKLALTPVFDYCQSVDDANLLDAVRIMRLSYLSVIASLIDLVGFDAVSEGFEHDVRTTRAELHDFALRHAKGQKTSVKAIIVPIKTS